MDNHWQMKMKKKGTGTLFGYPKKNSVNLYNI